MRIRLIAHPGAGDGVDVDRVVEAIQASGHEVLEVCSRVDAAAPLSDGVDLVAVAGGDGTVGSVLLDSAGSDVPVALIPSGTANNIARSLGHGVDALDRTLTSWASVPRRFELPAVRVADRVGRFAESVGAGLLAGAIEASDRSDADHDVAEARRLLADLAGSWPAVTAHVDADGHRWSGEVLAVEVLNIGTVGPNLVLAPGSVPGGPEVIVAALLATDRWAFRSLAQAPDGPVMVPALLRRGRKVRVTFDGPAPVHIDDELVEPAPIEAEVTGVAALVVGGDQPSGSAGG